MIDEEILKPVVVEGKFLHGYSISNTGNVYTNIIMKRKPSGGFESIIDPNQKKIMSPVNHGGYLRVPLYFPKGTFEYEYMANGTKNSQRRLFFIHQLVIDSFKPFDEFLPDCLSPKAYNNCDESIKVLLRQLFLVNHIDHNKQNNHISNLERVTPKQNSRNAKIFYNGNTANAVKIRNDL